MSDITQLVDYGFDFVLKWGFVGSRVTCNPPPTDTDFDVLMLIKESKFWDYVQHLSDQGFQLGGSDLVPAEEEYLKEWDGFQSYKLGKINLIITTSESFFNKFMDATEIAKERNLLKKEDRVALFQKILYNIDINTGGNE